MEKIKLTKEQISLRDDHSIENLGLLLRYSNDESYSKNILRVLEWYDEEFNEKIS